MADTDQDAGPTTQSTANAYLAAPPASLPGLSRPPTVPQPTPDAGPQQPEEFRDAPGYAALSSGNYAPGQDLTKQNTELADNQQSVDLKKKDANDLVLNALRGPQQPSLYQRIGDDYQRTPAMQARQMAQTFANPLMLAALVTGALTRNPAMGAIKAMTGVMEGINENDLVKQKLNAQKAKAHIGDTQLALEKETETIGSIINNKELDSQEQLARLLPIAAADQNPGLMDAVKRGDLNTIHHIYDGYKRILGNIGDAKKKTEELTGEFAGMTKADKSRILRERKEGEEGIGKGAGGKGAAKNDQEQQQVRDIVTGMENGRIPPNKAFYHLNAPIAAEAENRKFDMAAATREWNQSQREMIALNSQRMQQFVAVARDIPRQGEEVKLLAKQMDLGGLGVLNQAELEAYIRAAGNSEEGQLATRYVSALNTLKEMFANFAPGGYAPTESVWALANRQLNPEYGAKQQAAAVDELMRAVQYRLQSVAGLKTMGPGSPNRYTPQDVQPPQPMRAPTEQELQGARDAISKGAPRDAVIKMMNDNGIDHGGL